jgi:outer membrane protein TolC
MIAQVIALTLVSLSPPAVSLDEAERMAVAHSTEVRAARDSLKSAWARAGVISAKSHPQVGIAASAERFDDKTSVGLAGTSFEVLGDHTEEADLQIIQVIDVGNLLGTAHAQARIAATAAEFAVRSRISDQILGTKIAYMNVLRAAQGVKVAQATLDAYREQLKTATALWKQGIGQRIDVYRATSQVANAEKDLVQRSNDLNMARSVLNDQIGLPLGTATQLAEIPASEYQAGNEAVEALSSAALKHRSEAKSAALGVAAAQKGIRLARASNDPTVALAVSCAYFPTTSFSYPRQSIGTLSLTVNIPIYDGGEARAKSDDAAATLDTAKAQEEQVRRAISLQVQNALNGVESARKSVLAAEASLQAAIEARALAQQRFENQVGLYLEVTDAQAALSAAQAGRVNATYDLRIAEAQLERAIGDLTVPAQESRKP